uniref:Uncharacterized protein n=1 Tax=Candidatus Methanogaster sp. ANME-2c ERB4 TaxID=2759911 RepID=A0A7G9YL90_9EURY|nr:hypothetical protein GZ1D1_13 [uncultured archaeon GZfos1D1]QNO48774.1 hypothetical protein BEOMFINI_00013 [Methanosarcinales archaeon ANME-2c ERB4]
MVTLKSAATWKKDESLVVRLCMHLFTLEWLNASVTLRGIEYRFGSNAQRIDTLSVQKILYSPETFDLYTHLLRMGRRNKVIKLTEKKIRYIIRAKTKNDSTKNIAQDMKLSESTVKRVWMHWIKHHEPIPIKKFGRKKKEVDEGSEELILKVHEEQKLGNVLI